MKVEGSCHCGQIAYEAEVDPDKVRLCNCTDCQVLGGSAYRVGVPALRENFKLLRGQPKIYIKTADSGAKRAHGFCGNCGSPVWASDVSDQPPVYALRVGCLKQKAQLPPRNQIWCKSALDWAANISGVPGMELQ